MNISLTSTGIEVMDKYTEILNVCPTSSQDAEIAAVCLEGIELCGQTQADVFFNEYTGV